MGRRPQVDDEHEEIEISQEDLDELLDDDSGYEYQEDEGLRELDFD